MQQKIWAPWRVEYIRQKNKNKNCVFCFKNHGKHEGQKSLVLLDGKHAYIIMNKYPYISGHLMVVPKRHVSKLENLTKEEGLAIFEMTQKAVRVLKKAMKPHGLNVGLNLGRSAGSGITSHLHHHVVPRWNGDTNFMPVIGDVRVISNSLKNTYKFLAPHFKKMK